MCGINGGRTFRPIPFETIDRSLHAMRHRGPDESGVYRSGPVFLGNVRLSIIDTEGGRQPVYNEDRSVVAVMNGEIYNYIELRSELKSCGHEFTSQSDTEVIVHLYEEHGTAFLNKLRGMFALALYDEKRSRLLIARDRFGKKPLYYIEKPGELLFASELKGLRCLDEGNTWEIRSQGVYDYLSLGYVPQPETIFEGVRALPPASYLMHDGMVMRIARYWEPRFTPKSVLSYSDLMTEVRGRVEDSVRLRLRSDVPLGVFLSGGIDSSIVAFEASRIYGDGLQTFTVKMSDPTMDESVPAQESARFLGVSSTILPVDVDPVEDVLKTARLFDQPFADPSAVPMYLMSKAAANHVKVILTGDGGDEIFGGYRRYIAQRWGELLNWVPSAAALGFADLLAFTAPANSRYSGLSFAARFLRGLAADSGERYLVWTSDMLLDRDKKGRCNMNGVRPTKHTLPLHRVDGVDAVDHAMLSDLDVNLLSCLLVKTDMTTMAASIEARSPLLDHEVAEFAFSLPSHMKVGSRNTKRILRDAYRGLLPDTVIRGKKKGFDPPLYAWLTGPLRDLLMDMVGVPDAAVKDYLSSSFVNEVIAGDTLTDRNWAYVTYSLLMLELWLRGPNTA
jgi:asparagine synthase (glutamine-hydrolysing)